MRLTIQMEWARNSDGLACAEVVTTTTSGIGIVTDTASCCSIQLPTQRAEDFFWNTGGRGLTRTPPRTHADCSARIKSSARNEPGFFLVTAARDASSG